MNEHEAYMALQRASGIEVGDRVKVIRKAESNVWGWSACWVDDMDKIVGTEGVVEEVGDFGIVVYFDTDDEWTFPFFALEIVEKKNEKIRIGNYDVKFLENGDIFVGCQAFTFLEVKSVYKEMKRRRSNWENRTLYDWDSVSSEIMWIATDFDGRVFGYENEPLMDNDEPVWLSVNSDAWRVHQFAPDCDWKDSLEKRPD